MFRFFKRIVLPMLLLPLVAVACDDGTDLDQTNVSLELTDAAGEHVDHVWIGIEEIYFQGTGGRQFLVSSTEPGAADPPSELVELKALENATLSLAENVSVPSGSYGQLRFVIDRAVLEANGQFYSYNGAVPPTQDAASFTPDGDLLCPSCTETGIKALLPQDELPVEGDQKVIVLDFDVSRSFGQEAGASNMWVMTPIIVATDLGFTGGITGTVTSDVAIPQCPEGTDRDITVFQATATAQNLDDESGNDVVYTDSPDAEGNLAFDFLDPDTYNLGYDNPIQVTSEWQLNFTADFTPTSVDVTSGDQVTGVTYTITGAACESTSS